MQSKMLLFNRGIFVQNLRTVGWIFVAYLTALLFALPLQILMMYSREQQYDRMNHFNLYGPESLFRVTEAFQIILIFIVPLLLAIFLFRYMQVKQSADYIHSLPIKRGSLFHQHVAFGIVTLIVPIVITSIILFILSGVLDIPRLLNATNIFEWMFATILFTVFVFVATVFVGMFTGMSVLQGILTYILLLFPLGIFSLVALNLQYYLNGFPADYFLGQNIERLFLVVRAGQLSYLSLEIKEILIYLIIIVVMYVIAYFTYEKRNIEAATNAITFGSLQPIFLYGVTFCSMLVGGLYFGHTQNSIGWLIFGYVFASLIGYIVATMILEKTWRIFAKWKGYVSFAVAVTLLAVIIQFNVTEIENRIPNAENVEKVHFSSGFHAYTNVNSGVRYSRHFDYTDGENIERLRAIHQEIINNSSAFHNHLNRHSRPIVFVYELENGRKLARQYHVSTSAFDDIPQYKDLVESLEYKRNSYPALVVGSENIDRIVINGFSQLHKEVVITDRDDIASLHEIIQQELRNESYEQVLTEESGSWGEFQYLLNNDERIHTTWKKSYKAVETWLAERDLLEKARVTANDIDYIYVYELQRGMDIYAPMRSDEHMKQLFEQTQVVKVTDFNEIDELLQRSNYRRDGHYVLMYFSKNRTQGSSVETIVKEEAPAFLQQYFQ